VAAAAVLIASVCAVLVGGLVFFHSISALVFQTQP
jgi:hypothetical protein